MIKVQDWVASIPEEEKHVAYMGEGKSEQRQFLLCGDGWETYRQWGFFLDMAFDLESITSRDSRQVEETRVNSTKNTDETGVSTQEVTTKESYTVENTEVDTSPLSDIAFLDKKVTEEGILLTWEVLCQHTLLPGRLWATLRAVGPDTQQVKKSAMMVFEVDPSVKATAMDPPTVSEFEQMEARMVELCEEMFTYADDAVTSAISASRSQQRALEAAQASVQLAQQVSAHHQDVEEMKMTAISANSNSAQYAQIASSKADEAKNTAAQSAENMQKAVDLCSNYTMRCESAADDMDRYFANAKHHVFNVRDYGAVGEGGDDQAGIYAALQAAVEEIRNGHACEVYFPAGVYGIRNGGMGIRLPQGKGGLIIRGAGREITTIQYLEEWQNGNQYGNGWYALDIQPEGASTHGDYDTYIHDVAITGLTIRDDHPDKHATHTILGQDATDGEVRGVHIGYCLQAAVTDCNLIHLGGEAIDVCCCEDVTVTGNGIENCLATAPNGGAITVAEGSKGVAISGNTVTRSGADYVLTATDFGGADGITLSAGAQLSAGVELPDGTVIEGDTTLSEDTFIPVGTKILKNHCGVAVKSTYLPITDTVIRDNTILNVHGQAIHLTAANDGAAVANVLIFDNILRGCDIGIRASGSHPKSGVKIQGNIIEDCLEEALLTSAVEDITVYGNTFRNIQGDYAVNANGSENDGTQLFADNIFENLANAAVACGGTTVIKDCLFQGVGIADTPLATLTPAINRQAGALTVSGCLLKDIRLKGVKSGIYGANIIENTDIELVAKNGSVNAGGEAINHGVRRLIGGKIGGRIVLNQPNAIVQGVSIVSSNIGSHAIIVIANGVSVTGCNIQINAQANVNAINENSGCNNNLFANNIVSRPIKTVGARTIVANNVDTSVS